MKQIRVLIVDDHEMVREALAEIIGREMDMAVVGQAGDGRAGAEKAAQLQPDVITMDVAMPNLNGLDAVRQIFRSSPRSRVLMLTAYEEDFYIGHALHAGVDGFISKRAASAELAQAIRDIGHGRKHYSPAVLARISRHRTGEKQEKPGGIHLTGREIEVLQLIAEGNANKQTAGHLNISIKTVEKHRQRLMEKLRIHDTAGLTRYAVSAGLVEAPRRMIVRSLIGRGAGNKMEKRMPRGNSSRG